MDATPIEPNAALLERLGLVVVRWALIERQLGDLSARLLRADRGPFFAVTGEASAGAQLLWIRYLVEGGFPDATDRASIFKLISTLEELQHQVKDLAGGIWLPGPTAADARVESVRFGRTEPLQHKVVDVAYLDQLTARLAEASTELGTLLSALRRRATQAPIAPAERMRAPPRSARLRAR